MEEQSGVGRPEITSFITIQNMPIIFSPLFSDIQPDTAPLCAAFHLIVSTAFFFSFTLLDEIIDT